MVEELSDLNVSTMETVPQAMIDIHLGLYLAQLQVIVELPQPLILLLMWLLPMEAIQLI